MVAWTLRRACQGDAVALASCIDRAYAIYESCVSDLPAVSDGIANDIANNIVWVAVQKEQIIAGIVLIEEDDHVVLANVAVDPRARGKGLGRALMGLAESEASRLCKHTMRLSTHVEMPENVRLYEHLGWHETGRSGSKVFMEKRLGR